MTANSAITPPMPPKRPSTPRSYPVSSLKRVMNTITHKCGDVSIAERHGRGGNKVIFLPEATKELESIVTYGRRSPMNILEQKYEGFGHFIQDENGHFITIVSHFIQIHTMNRTATSARNFGPYGTPNAGLEFLEYYREEFLKGEERYNTDASGNVVDPFLKFCGPSEFVLEGHTHPNLGVFFSGPDRSSGAARAATSPICIFVCDPIRKQMLGATGKDFEPTEVIVYKRLECPHADTPEDTGRIEEDERLVSPADELARLANQCLQTGYSGEIQLYTRLDGKNILKIKLAMPKDRKSDSCEK